MPHKRKTDYFKETLKDQLTFSTKERKGLFAVLLILFLLIIIRFAVAYWPQKQVPQDANKFDKEVAEFLAANKMPADSSDHEIEAQSKSFATIQTNQQEHRSVELFKFNPNDLPEEDWKHLGFSDRQIKSIKNYEAKGGRFYTKEDVRKMYLISEAEYLRIEPYIVIPPAARAYENKVAAKPSYDDLKIDIATADTTELKKLRGIGSGYANRIVKYRMKLGGFYSVDQLHEVWGLSDSLFQEIAPHVYISDNNKLNKIDVNRASVTDFKSHPYFNYNLANGIVNYRQQHGEFKLPADIKRLPLVNDELYRKIAPYLKVE